MKWTDYHESIYYLHHSPSPATSMRGEHCMWTMNISSETFNFISDKNLHLSYSMDLKETNWCFLYSLKYESTKNWSCK